MRKEATHGGPSLNLRPMKKLCFYELTLIKNKAHTRIREASLQATQVEPNTIILQVIGDQLTMDDVVEHVQIEWQPSNGFHVEDMGKN